ncbi:MAG: efflux RND transporter periplasmic adaptor subunit [Paramuribaculum sp.]
MNYFRYLCAALFIAALASCHDHSSHGDKDHEHDHEHPSAETETSHEAEGHSDEIVFHSEKAAAAGVVADTVRIGEFSAVVPVSGRVLPASGDEATVAATVSGIVKMSRPLTEGARIERGTPLFSISTSSLPEGDVTQRAKIAYEAALTEYERAQKLIADQLISRKEFTAIKAEYEKARLSYEAVSRGGRGGLSVSAPVSGYIKEYLVKDGDFVNLGQPLMSITQNRSIHLRAELAEKDFGVLNNIVSAKFKTSYSDSIYDLRLLNGRVLSTGKTTGTGSSFVPVTFEFDNCPGVIPGSFVEIFLITNSKHNAVIVPVSALTEDQGVFYVYLKLDENCYRRQEVSTGESDGDNIEILSGLKPGDTVVTKGAIHVKLASAGKAIPGHTHNH